MKFSATNCNFFYRFYNYVLNKYYGIGKGSLSYKDRLFAYLNIHWEYLDYAAQSTDISTTFVGEIIASTQVIPKPTSTKFYENDQAAFDDGVSKNDIYYLSQNNTYGLPFGTPKKLVEDVS